MVVVAEGSQWLVVLGLHFSSSQIPSCQEFMTARGGQYEIGCTCCWTDYILRIQEEYLCAQVTTSYPTSDVPH